MLCPLVKMLLKLYEIIKVKNNVWNYINHILYIYMLDISYFIFSHLREIDFRLDNKNLSISYNWQS